MGNRKWTNETCYEEARKYHSRSEFASECSGAYKASIKKGWIDDYDWFEEKKKPNGYWNKEHCFEEARKYKSRNELRRGCKVAYRTSIMNEWIDEFTWFEPKQQQKPSGYWNYDTCYEEAIKYHTRNEFAIGCSVAYKVALKNKWINEYDWFEEKKKPSCYWENYDNSYQEAQKYTTRREFNKGNQSAYHVAIKNGWINNFTWLKETRNPRGYWNKERCFEEAQKYKSRNEFQKGSNVAYSKARENEWLDDYDWLEDQRFDLIDGKIDCVYVYEFKEQNTAYIGRTLIKTQKRRDRDHIFKLDSVSSFAKEHNIAVPPMMILETNLTIKEGAKQEGYWLKKYQEDGWITLNKAKTGSIGSIAKGKWNYKRCKEEAMKYKSRSEFKKGKQRAYQVARINHWLDDYIWFEQKCKPNGYWNNYEHCYEESLKYKTRMGFKKGSNTAYDSACKNHWLDDFFPKAA